jgi:hypothetical protein
MIVSSFDQMCQRTAKPVEFPNDQHIAVPDVIEAGKEIGPLSKRLTESRDRQIAVLT